MDPTNTIQRFQSAGKALGEARHRNREEGFAIIVEGYATKQSASTRLHWPIEVVNRGWGMDRLAHICTKRTEQNHDRRSTSLADGLGSNWRQVAIQSSPPPRIFDVMIDENLRKNLMKTLKPETRVVESLGGLAGALIPHMDLEATIRNEQE